MYDELIKLSVERIFVHKKCNLSSNMIKAAIITAVSKMANMSSIVTSEEVIENLLNVYDVRDNKEVLSLLGMNYRLIFNLIDYRVDLDDLTSSSIEYHFNKDNYDLLYLTIKENLKENYSLIKK